MAERAYLVGVSLPDRSPDEAKASLAELARLASSAGAELAGEMLQARRSLDPATYIGSGKVGILGDLAREAGAGLIVFDDELRPSQQRNLEEALGLKVLDRTQLILDVFATRASTNEGRLQVELAQLSYLLPRLVGSATDLDRMGGGIGTRGPGETKLEADRRRLRDRIAQLRGEIELISRTRSLQRSKRRKSRAKIVALAGYTNAGKSSLFNALCSAKVYVEDRLFATLDPTVRPMEGGQGGPLPLLLVDTVGFVRKLPHALVAAFRATLEEVAEADLVLRVVDAADPAWPSHLASADAVLDEVQRLYGGGRPRPEIWLAFNKIDRLSAAKLKELKAEHPEASFLSAIKGTGLEALKKRLTQHMEQGLQHEHYLIPHDAMGRLSRSFKDLRIVSQRWTAQGLRLEAVLSQELPLLAPYRVTASAKVKR